MKTDDYFKKLKTDVDKVYDMAGKAREKGFDFSEQVEIPLAMSMAEKVVGLISNMYPQMRNSGIADRIKELEKEHGKLEATVVFKIGEEVARQKFCKFDDLLQAIDAGIRIGLAYITLGVVSSPMEGYTGLKTRKRKDNGKEFLEASFAGPIRSAGTTASCIVLMLIDYLRETFGYAKYDPTEEEIKRVYAELEHFHDRVTNLQYMPTEEEANFLAKNMPILVAGDPSEKVEVPNYKNLDRIETNFLRSGYCLVMAEGLAQKAPKGFRKLKQAKKDGIKSTGFDFLEEYLKIHEKTQSGKSSDGGDTRPTYIKDLVAGRPVYGHPSRRGGLRYRYGRGRTSGFSAASVHPATMAITDGFISNGTQLKIEKPTKGCAVTSCDSIEGPIVKLKDKSVKKPLTTEEAKKIYPEVEEIIYLGDLLFPFSDLANRNAELIKPGYVEEWWNLELKKAIKENKKSKEIETIDPFNISLEKAIEISRNYSLPLHPKYIFFWDQIDLEEDLGKEGLINFIKWLKNSKIEEKIILPFNKEKEESFAKGKRVLEILGIEHMVTPDNVVINKENSKALLANLGIDIGLVEKKESVKLNEHLNEKEFDKSDKRTIEIIDLISNFKIKDKAGEFIGARMGRPEKAKLRKLQGSPNMLFPVGKEGGKMRSLQSTLEIGEINNDFPLFFCKNCKKETIYPVCENCNKKTIQMYFFSDLKEKSFNKKEQRSNLEEGVPYSTRKIDIKHYYQKALEKIGMKRVEAPKLIKGVRGTSSKNHGLEHLSKGLLRAKYGLQVNKDGTIRVDGTELPLFYFKPSEIGASVEKLRELGYTKDIYGKSLEKEDQLVESMPHDILIPAPTDSFDERGDEVFMKIANFVDEELEKIYGIKKFYNIKKREDLIGHIGVAMAPHNCAGVAGRIIGFSKVQGIYASPYIHAAIRRDCDGDEAAIMLLGDVLLNFSKEFLPGHRGGTQDAPLVLNAKIDAGEVDDQILDLEMCWNYPLELYEAAEEKKHSSEVDVEFVEDIMKKGENPFLNMGYTHDTSDMNGGVLCSAYKKLGTMQEKVEHQMELAEKLRAVDTADTARLVIDRHFIRDMKGNLRKFSQQEFRCVDCNLIMRRPPLHGKCPKCGGKIIFTIHEGGIKKYLEPALTLSRKYHLSQYTQQNIELVKRYIDSIFGKELEKQENIDKWF